MRKPYNYRNPLAEDVAKEDRITDIKEVFGIILFLANLVGWCLVLK